MAKKAATDPGLDPVMGEMAPGLNHDGPVQIVTTHDGAAFFTPPSAWRKLTAEQRMEFAALQQLVSQIHVMQGHLELHVQELRDAGLSWHMIGWALGTTGEAARQRFGGRERGED